MIDLKALNQVPDSNEDTIVKGALFVSEMFKFELPFCNVFMYYHTFSIALLFRKKGFLVQKP